PYSLTSFSVVNLCPAWPTATAGELGLFSNTGCVCVSDEFTRKFVRLKSRSSISRPASGCFGRWRFRRRLRRFVQRLCVQLQFPIARRFKRRVGVVQHHKLSPRLPIL